MANSATPEQDMVAQVLAVLQAAGAETGESDYDAARKEFGGMPWGPIAPGVKPEGFVTSPTGKILYPNGAIYDPATRRTIYPLSLTAAVDIAGSDAWLREIQDTWDEDDIKEWRKKLAEQGYQVSETGGWAEDLKVALAQYHAKRYANFGKPLPLIPGGITDRESVRKTVDFQALKEEVKTWGQVPFSEDLDDSTAEYFSERMIRKMVELQRKHPEWSPEQIQSGANLRVQKEFVKTPGVKSAIRDVEEDEMDESLRESIVSVSTLGRI